ncbi:cytochrome d ubiquinol oxidase subunit II [Lactococcus allomyrinae]|uniref:Cytochrome d ubiquinol oxidase subunit II n=1 Tax=Lactococcus allomyrinae TaxID=2419773 RepID=A0A387BF69_9LACT|nr:cytochrome d ubiquinol oxidase subunit II [Lactococcus allomyrinae]AYF99745.1 cytochrome d ubiquinol oxidase subunit II [Lactococcus allomyrinae]
MTGLQLFWFIIVGVLFSGFFFLEGFDYGVGMSAITIAKDKREIEQTIGSIGPVWDLNEVWLLTAGGAMFASFPYWYASLFSGFYLVLFLILVGLIFRGVTFEFRHHAHSEKGKMFWTKTLGVASFAIPFLFGLMFTSMIQGVPMDAHGNVSATFTTYVNPLSVVGGVAVLLLAWLHGLNYLALKTEGDLRARSAKVANILYFVLYAGEVVFAVLLAIFTDFFEKHFVGTLVLLVAIVVLTVVAHLAVRAKKEMTAFIASGLTFVALVALIFQGIFPRVMIATNPAHSILIKNASSTGYTLTAMTIVTLCILPFVLVYIGWTYYVFRKRIKK